MSLNDVKKKIISDLNDELAKLPIDKAELEKIKSNVFLSITQGVVATTPIEDELIVNSNTINKNFIEMYSDLTILFSILNKLSSSLNYNKSSLYKYESYIESKILELQSLIEKFNEDSFSLYTPDFKIDRLLHFNNNFSDEIYSILNYDKDLKLLRLPIIKMDDVINQSDIKTASISKSYQHGAGFIDFVNQNALIQNVINLDKNSTWSETILSDAPIKLDSHKERPNEMRVNDGYFYNVPSGALCEVEMKFENVNVINTVEIIPNSKYPMELIAIRYKVTDDDNELLTELVYPENARYTLRSSYIDDKLVYSFPDAVCKNLYFLFRQNHNTRETYIYNKKAILENQLWFNSINKIKNNETTLENEEIYKDREELTPYWSNFNFEVVNSGLSFIDILTNNKEVIKKVTKYEYSYGLSNISCFNIHYDRVGIYEFEPVFKKNIQSVAIHTKEEHPLDSLFNNITDIEYYISKNDGGHNWHSILPSTKDVIESEFLNISINQRAFLRFKAIEVIAVMENGVTIDHESKQYILERNQGTGLVESIQLINYDYDSVYSIKYKPEDSSKIVTLDSNPININETFEGVGSYIVLSKSPYIENSIDFCTINIYESSANTSGEVNHAINVTDISNPASSHLKFDYSSTMIQFYVLNDIVHFNKELNNEHIIEVSYNYLPDSIKLKAIMRRNSNKDGWLSPAIKEIKYELETC